MKVGDYVRTNDRGIRRIGTIIDDLFYRDEEDNLHYKGNLIKSSPNIIDLIEVGDYVNGYQVIEKPYIYHDVQFVSVDTQDSWDWGKGEMPIKNIKSIVTKEQFSQMEYKIGE